jgi:preprotein translocase subunit SecA
MPRREAPRGGHGSMDWNDLSDRLSAFGDDFGRFLKRTFGSQNERVVRQLTPLVGEIGGLEAWAKGLSAEQFRDETEGFKRRLAEVIGEDERAALLDQILPKAFALVREASVRTLGLRHFDVQLVGGVILHQGAIAEMMTGEGKTLVATLPLYLNCLAGKPVYLVTVNDYLARRDCAWMKPIYDYLGVTCGAIQSSMGSWERKPIYACDIVYGTNNEFGFDYLRDNMKSRVEDQVQRHLAYAIVDEVDSILIDEARTPLIISGPAEESSAKYKVADLVAKKLVRDEHFEIKEKERQAILLEKGIEEAEKLVGVDSFYTPQNAEWPHFIENALRAHYVYQRDDEYVIEPGEDGKPEVVIVDEFTGRKMHGRRWSDGLHQAVEAKEGIPPRQENQTLATITFQNYFRLFRKLAGMTGTAMTEANEFWKIYKLRVVSIPTNLPVDRTDAEDVVYRTAPEKWKAIADEIERVHAEGQPMLVGTTSVEKSEHLSQLLTKRGIRHEVLNAKNHEREASIVAHAGEIGAVTVATNMAGRGTDIKLGGNFEWRLKKALAEAGLVEGDLTHLDEIAKVRERVREECQRDEAKVLELGGLYVLGTERHEARRIDNQLRGRSGRQGDVGESRFFLSLQDDLMRRFYREWVTNFMEKLGMTEGQPIESRMVTRAIERAQKKVEDYNFEIRKSLLEYDDVMDQQRKTIYAVRQSVLEGEDLRERAEEFIKKSVLRASRTHVEDVDGFLGWYHRTFGVDLPREVAKPAVEKEPELAGVLEAVKRLYDEREAAIGAELMRRVEQYILLNALDTRWKDHLYTIDALKTAISLRGYGQTDPKNEYKREGFELFQNLLGSVEDEVASLLLRIRVEPRAPEGGSGAPPPAGGGTAPGGGAQPPGAPPGPRGPGAPPAPGADGGAPRARPIARPLQSGAPIPATHAFDLKRRNDAIRRLQEIEQAKTTAGTAPAEAPKPRTAAVKAVGRNDPCPCGSGKKYKKCCGAA